MLYSFFTQKGEFMNTEQKEFLDLAVLSFSSPFTFGKEKDEMESQYQTIIKKYEGKETAFSDALAKLVLALEHSPEQDFLGEIYMEKILAKGNNGQTITPYDVASLCSKISCGEELEKQITEKGYITINDPACGTGVMLIAFANHMRELGINYQKDCLFIAQDIVPQSAKQCFLQLSLLGCSAIISCGNSITNEIYDTWYTPMYHINFWKFQ